MEWFRHVLHWPTWRLLSYLRVRHFPSPVRGQREHSSSRELPPQTPVVKFPIAVYSHRGGPLETEQGVRFVENTLPAFANSVRLGADLLETDVQLTRDKQVVLLHDADMGRLFGPRFAGRSVAEFDYHDLPPLDVGPSTSGATHNQVPLLDDLLRSFPNSPVQIDLKVPTPGLVDAVLSVLRRHNRAGGGTGAGVLWGSFIHSINTACYSADPGIPLFTSAARLVYLLACYRAGVCDAVAAHMYESAVICPRRAPLRWPLDVSLLDAGWFAWLQQRRVAVVVYENVNSPRVFERCAGAGANGLCTDRPGLLVEWMKTHTVRPPPGAL